MTGHVHWGDDFARAANSAYLELSLDAAAADVNAWIAEIATRTIRSVVESTEAATIVNACSALSSSGASAPKNSAKAASNATPTRY